MVDFFCRYIQNDCIGSFANAHLVWADMEKNGIFSQKCLGIAKNYPYVLDFAKHGTTKFLKKNERPDQYPDFMQKGLSANSYHSKRALGSLYRSSRVLDACSSKINLTVESAAIDPDLNYPGWQEYEESAEKHKQNYIDKMSEILRRYSLKCEAEAFTGVVELEVTKKWRNEKLNTTNVVESYIQNIMVTFRNIFLREVEAEVKGCNLSDSDGKERKFRRASAWYMVVYGKSTSVGLSFPWVLSDILIDIKSSRCAQVDRNNIFLTDLDVNIQQCIQSGDLKCDADENISCQCRATAKAILLKWIAKARLNIWSLNKTETCSSCFTRIISHFESNSNVYCCSGQSSDKCTCSVMCSPAKLVLDFLKFFVKHLKDSIGSCVEGCDGFISRNLQELSLQTLANLAIFRNALYLGLHSETNALSASVPDDINEEEGDPIKIPVRSEGLKNILERYRDEVMAYLKKNSGVKYIILRPEKDLHGNHCLIVNSSGKNWQRWNLQEILLDPEFTQKIVLFLNLQKIPIKM